MGYLNPALNNPALGLQGLNKVNGTCMHLCISYTNKKLLFALVRVIQLHSQDLGNPSPVPFSIFIHSQLSFLYLPHRRPWSLGARGGDTVSRMKG